MIENIEVLKADYANLVNDIRFDQLDLELDKPNIFEILGAVNNELKHSNMLAWILNPQGSHGVNNAILKRVLREIAKDERAVINEFEIEELNYSNVEIRREWNNIDLLIIFDETVICIENKIWSKETGKQLLKYKEIVNKTFGTEYRRIFVYLSPYGEAPNNETDVYVNLSYEIIIYSIERILSILSKELNEKIVLILQDYLTILKRYMMDEDELIKSARQLYKNHRRIFDFVYEHKPDHSEEIKPFIEQKVLNEGWVLGPKNKGIVRFLTPALSEQLPSNSATGGLSQREPLLFEIDYWWSARADRSSSKLFFKVSLQSGGGNKLRDRLIELLKEHPDFGKVYGQKSSSHFMIKQAYKWEDIMEDAENIKGYLDKLWPKIKDVVTRVEKDILKSIDKIKETVEQ